MATRRINFEDMRDAQKMPHSQSTQSQFYETNTQQDRRNQEQKIGAVVFHQEPSLLKTANSQLCAMNLQASENNYTIPPQKNPKN